MKKIHKFDIGKIYHENVKEWKKNKNIQNWSYTNPQINR